jgi:hypothetical protein
MVSRYNLRTDFKFCTVVWYHKIQIYVGEDKRIKGRVGTVWGKWERGKDFGKWERGKDFGKWVTCGKY